MKKITFIAPLVLGTSLLLGGCGEEEAAPKEEPTNEVEEVENVEQAEETTEHVDNELTLGITPEDFVQLYNNFRLSNNIATGGDLVLGEVNEGPVNNTMQFNPNNNSSIVATMNTNNNEIKHVMFIGIPDGSDSSTTDLFLSLGATIGAVDTKLSADERGDILKELGLMSDIDITDHKGETIKNDLKYSLSINDVTGIMLGIEKNK